jgi:hypothetical protein
MKIGSMENYKNHNYSLSVGVVDYEPRPVIWRLRARMGQGGIYVRDRNDFSADTLDWLAILYLALPVVIFFCGWLRGPFAGLGCLAIAALLLSLKYEHVTALPWRWFAIGSVVGLVWASMGGAGHFFYANADWYTRDAVLRDLTVFSWPVAYGDPLGSEYMLRAPLGYYLPVALLAKFVGLARADLLLFVWTVAGLALFICMTLRLFPSRAGKTLWLIFLPWFGGADAVGWLLSGFPLFHPGQHLQLWAYYFSYSCTSTLLFWAPNHGLVGWLAAALLLRHWHRPSAFWLFAFLFAVTPLWSPLVTIGVAPFALGWFITALRDPAGRFPRMDWRVVLCVVGSLTIFLMYAPWLVAGSASLSKRSAFEQDWVDALHRLILLQVLEWGVLAVLISHSLRDVKYWAAIITLIALPFFNFGVNNDLVMRSSILALIVLFYLGIHTLIQSMEDGDRARRVMISIVLVIGAMTPAQEFIRALTRPRWQPNLQMNLVQVSNGYPPNYVVPWEKMPVMIQELYVHPDQARPAVTAQPGAQ